MKKIINGKLYNTDTAKEIGCGSANCSSSDLFYWCETLYCKRTGEYFLHGVGNAGSKYAESCGQNTWTGGEKIIPMSYDSAHSWAEKYLSADEYQEEFGEITEDDSLTTMSICVPADIAAKIRREAQIAEMSVSAYIASKF